MAQTLTYPIDYITAACALAIYEQPGSNGSHFLTPESIHNALSRAINQEFSIAYTQMAIANLHALSVFRVVDDAYADTVIVTTDSAMRELFTSREGTGDIYDRAYVLGMSWLSTAFRSQQFWDALSNDAPSDTPATIAPSSEGFVTFDHNQENEKSVIVAVEVAMEAVRTNNEVEDNEKGWVQSHLAAGLVLVQRGGSILKDALISTVLKPLQSALKYVIEEKGKLLIAAAIKFLMSFF